MFCLVTKAKPQLLRFEISEQEGMPHDYRLPLNKEIDLSIWHNYAPAPTKRNPKNFIASQKLTLVVIDHLHLHTYPTSCFLLSFSLSLNRTTTNEQKMGIKIDKLKKLI